MRITKSIRKHLGFSQKPGVFWKTSWLIFATMLIDFTLVYTEQWISSPHEVILLAMFLLAEIALTKLWKSCVIIINMISAIMSDRKGLDSWTTLSSSARPKFFFLILSRLIGEHET